MTISMDKPYTTRDGRPVRLLCVDAPGDYPVIGLDGAITRRWRIDGWPPNDQTEDRLIEAKPRVQCEVWIWRNEIGTFEASVWSTPKGHPPVARVTIDVEEGHGLEGGE